MAQTTSEGEPIEVDALAELRPVQQPADGVMHAGEPIELLHDAVGLTAAEHQLRSALADLDLLDADLDVPTNGAAAVPSPSRREAAPHTHTNPACSHSRSKMGPTLVPSENVLPKQLVGGMKKAAPKGGRPYRNRGAEAQLASV